MVSYKILRDVEGHFDLWVNGKVNAYSLLSLGLSIRNSVNSGPNYFKLSTVVVDKETSGCMGITSSLYSN